MKTIKEILDSRTTTTIIVVVVMALFISWGINQYNNLKTEVNTSKPNVLALNDTLRVTKTKNGDLEYSKQILVAKNNKELKELNKELFEIYKKIDGKVHELSNIKVGVIHDTVIIDSTRLVKLSDSIEAFKWSYNKTYDSENYRKLAGMTLFQLDTINNVIIPLETKITTDEIKFNLVHGLRTTKDGKIEIFSTSRYPYLKVEDLNSTIIDPATNPIIKKFNKPKRIGFGAYTGLGGTVNLSNSNVIVGPQIGVGLTYKLF